MADITAANPGSSQRAAKPDRSPRAALVAAAMFALLCALWAGLVRMGWSLPPVFPTLAPNHGPLMVAGFLGTLVALERAAALGGQWALLAPLCNALGALGLVFGLPAWVGALLMTLGAAGIVAIFGIITRRQPELFNAMLLTGSVALTVGNTLWLVGGSVVAILPWWVAFLVLTIAGERLELNRLLRPTPLVRALFLGAVALFLVGPVLALSNYDLGWRVAGAGMLSLAIWLLVNDIARRTVRLPGLTRYIAICLLSGYVWLAAAGALALTLGIMRGFQYDAILHAIFLGFVITMIFGHAPVIFPAVLRLPMPMQNAFYGHLVLLHVSLLMRVGGDLLRWAPASQWGGLLNVIALLLFVANTARSIYLGQQVKPLPPRV